MWWKLAPTIFLGALGVIVIGLPLVWLRMKVERKRPKSGQARRNRA